MNPEEAALAVVRQKRREIQNYIDTAPEAELAKEFDALAAVVQECEQVERELTEEIENG